MQRGLSAYRNAILAGLFLFGILSLGIAQSVSAAEAVVKTVSVTGNGIVKARPDAAMIHLNVSVLVAGSASQAQKENAATTDRLIDVLDRLGIDEQDVRSGYFSIWPEYDYSKVPEGEPLNQANAYRVENQLQVEVRELEMTSRVIEEATAVENVLLQGVNYYLEDQKPYLQEAREKAAVDAMAKAQALGDILHFTVGKIMSVTENSYYYGPASYGGGYGGGTGSQQVDVTLDINVVFELLTSEE